jgi:RNA-binding protein 26
MMQGMGMPGMAGPMDVDIGQGGGLVPMPNMMMGMQSGMMAPSGAFHGVPTGPRGVPRGAFNGATGFGATPGRPERRQDKTIVVEKIPEGSLSIEAVTAWFKRFGTVTNVAVDVAGAKALVSFEDHDAAHKAWKSEDAVFGNRFVKVFWHRPMTGHGAKGTALLAASATLVNKLSTDVAAAPSAAQASPAVSALAQKQQALEQHIAEQKALMARLATASPDEKKILFGQLRALGEEIKKATGGAPVPTASSRPTPATASTSKAAEDEEARKRAELDRQLDAHAATVPAEGSDGTEALKAQLARLKAEAASLGIPETGTPPAPSHSGFRGGYRGGRARGRGGFRATPYPPRGGGRMSMKLDNRPKKLLIKGAPADKAQAVRDWYEVSHDRFSRS